MESFFSLLERRVDDCSSLLCVGLDPHPDDLKARAAAEAQSFCIALVRATAPYAAAFKPNAAFFEIYGAEGWVALKHVIDAVGEESQRRGSHIPVILDAKRGDIASTAQAYASAAFDSLGADAITVSPYLGGDSVEPFLRNPEKGAFLLCKTSNPGSRDLQDLRIQGEDGQSQALYLRVASLARAWNAHQNLGLVVGATFPDTLREIRATAPGLWILAPGIGAQGGELEAAMQAGLRTDAMGLLISVSRGISRAPDPAAAAAELRDLIAEIRQAQKRR